MNLCISRCYIELSTFNSLGCTKRSPSNPKAYYHAHFGPLLLDTYQCLSHGLKIKFFLQMKKIKKTLIGVQKLEICILLDYCGENNFSVEWLENWFKMEKNYVL